MAQPEVSWPAAITAVVAALREAVLLKMQRFLRTLILALMLFILLTTTVVTLLIVGVVHLGDALAQVCSRWFADPLIGDLVVGLTFVMLPLVVILVLRRRHAAEKKR